MLAHFYLKYYGLNYLYILYINDRYYRIVFD